MKICLINNLYGKLAKGGAEAIVTIEAEALAALGHEVVVISSVVDPDGAAVTELPGGGSPVRHRGLAASNIYFYGDGSRHAWPVRLLWHLVDTFNFVAAYRLRKILLEEKPDAVHTHNLMGIGFLTPRLLRRMGLRHLHTVHDVQLVNPSGCMAAGESGFLIRTLESVHAHVMRNVFGSPNVVVSASEFLLNFYGRRGFFAKSRKTCVPNPAPSVSESRDSLVRPLKFVFVGQVERHKGILELLAAWKKARIADAGLTIIGAGRLDDVVERATAENRRISIRGKLPRPAIMRELETAAYLIVPSRVIENYPTVIMEAFAAGVPVIASSSGGIPELVHDGETGFLVENLTAENLAAALKSAAVVSSDAWLRMSSSCQKVAAERTVERYCGAIVELLKF